MFEDILKKKGDLEYPTQYVLLGQTYSLKGKYNKAIKAYQKCLRIKPSSPKAQLYIANAWAKKGAVYSSRYRRKKAKCFFNALKHYNRARSLSPQGIIGECAGRKIKETRARISDLTGGEIDDD
jgi:tetratricopeptide (TPR) repeat protein